MERENELLYRWSTQDPLERKEQVIINKELGIRIARNNDGNATIIIACRSGTQVSLQGDETKIFNPEPKKDCFTDFALPLTDREKVQVGNYLIRALISPSGTSLIVESDRFLDAKTSKAKRKTLRRVLSDLSLEDSRSPQ